MIYFNERRTKYIRVEEISFYGKASTKEGLIAVSDNDPYSFGNPPIETNRIAKGTKGTVSGWESIVVPGEVVTDGQLSEGVMAAARRTVRSGRTPDPVRR